MTSRLQTRAVRHGFLFAGCLSLGLLTCGASIACIAGSKAVAPAPVPGSKPVSAVVDGGAGEWRAYAGDKASTKYSALSQINRDNIQNLRIVWRQSAVPPEIRSSARGNARAPSSYPHTPLMAGGLLYMSSGVGTIAALDPTSGHVVWFDQAEGAASFASRGLAYWSDGKDARVIAVSGRYLVALNAKTGARYNDFGDAGRVDLITGFERLSEPRYRWGQPQPSSAMSLS